MINYLVPFGTRCTTDSFLQKYKLRKLSSPISYAIADFSEAIKLFDLDNTYIVNNIIEINNENRGIMYNDYWRFSKKFYHISGINIDISNNIYNGKNLLWNHHNLKTKTGIQTLLRRKERVDKICRTKSNVYFFTISKIIELSGLKDTITYYIENFRKFKYNNCKLIVILTISDFSEDIKFIQHVGNIDFWGIYTESLNVLTSYRPKGIIYPHYLDNDLKNENIPWDNLYKNLKTFYDIQLVDL
jgi:hypothetical protein